MIFEERLGVIDIDEPKIKVFETCLRRVRKILEIEGQLAPKSHNLGIGFWDLPDKWLLEFTLSFSFINWI